MKENKEEVKTRKPQRVCAFDIGFRNLAFCVMEVGDADSPLETSRIISIHNEDILQGVSRKDVSPNEIYEKVYGFLTSHHAHFSSLDVILIEQQMSQKHVSNIMALKISMLVYGYFQHVVATAAAASSPFARQKIRLLEYPSTRKTRAFKAPFFKKKSDRKKWAIQKVLDLFPPHLDPVWQDMIESKKKKDDVADCILMCLSFYLSG